MVGVICSNIELNNVGWNTFPHKNKYNLLIYKLKHPEFKSRTRYGRKRRSKRSPFFRYPEKPGELPEKSLFTETAATCIIHSTPYNFGAENSGAIIGIQMASAYVGSTFIPPLFGLLGNAVSFSILPVYLLGFVVLMITMVETTFRITRKEKVVKI